MSRSLDTWCSVLFSLLRATGECLKALDVLHDLLNEQSEEPASKNLDQLFSTFKAFQITPRQRNCSNCEKFRTEIVSYLVNLRVAAGSGCATCKLVYSALDRFHHVHRLDDNE